MTDPARTDHDLTADLLIAALDRPPETRRAWLAGAVADAGMRTRVLALLDAHDADGPLDTPLLVRELHDSGGQRVGPWRLVDRLGEGGMGTVWRAERADGTYDRAVALKLLRTDGGSSGGGSDALAVRLAAERQILARLEHPRIARLYDGGVTDDGRPYLVLERVDGQPITAHADARGLGVPERLRLFLQVCDAVAYAHQNLVVHRDLKPSNVFVTDAGEVKLLDFGIAKLLEDPGVLGGDDALTRSQIALTPSYAAPEQLRRAPVTTATDVYALGVMLYELLSGARPYALTGLTPADAERLVCETDPPPPSSVAPPARARAVRGDLDTIVARALAKEPLRRYASADALAADIQRHLDGVPVVARPPTMRYRAGRFVRRNRVGVAAGAAVAVALVAGMGGTAWQARKAEAEARKAEAVNDFLVGMLGAPDPTEEGRDVRVATLLDRAGASVDSAFADQPDVAASMHRTLGIVYRELGLYADAHPHLRAALDLRQRGAARERLQSANDFGELLYLQDSLAAADALLTPLLGPARALPPGDDLRAAVLGNLGYVRFFQRDLVGSRAMHEEALAVLEAQSLPDSVEMASQMGNVAVVRTNLGEHAAAAAILERQVAIYRARLGPGNVRVARALNNLGSAYYAAEQPGKALAAATEAVAVFRSTVPAGSPELAGALSNLAPILLALDRPADAESALREAIAGFEPALGRDHVRTLAARIKLGQVLIAQDRPTDAEPLLRAALLTADAKTPESHPLRANTRVALAAVLVATGRPAGAVSLLREAVALREATLPDGHADRAVALSLLGDALRRAGRAAEAAPLLRESHAALARTLGPAHRLTRDAADRLAALQAP